MDYTPRRPPARVDPDGRTVVPARRLAGLARDAMAAARATLAGGLAGCWGPGGPRWRDPFRRRVFVRLSGASSPYSGKEVVDVPGGTWAFAPGGMTFAENLHEDNAKAALDGKVVEAHRAGPSWWRFQFERHGTASSEHPPCTLTVHLQSRCDGSPIAGATVTVAGYPAVPGPTTSSGTTDASGDFVPEAIPFGASLTLTVSYMGCTFTRSIGTGFCPVINLCFCTIVSTVTVDGGSPPGLVMSGFTTFAGVLESPFGPFSPVDGMSTPFGVVSASGATWTFTLCDISLCSSAIFLASGNFEGTGGPDWVPACDTINLDCCTPTNSLTLTPYHWTPCYNDIYAGPAGSDPSPWNCCLPACVNPAEPTGYYPKTIEATWSSTYNHYGDDSTGGPITLHLTSDLISIDPRTGNPCRHIIWDSGCRGPRGNFYSLPSGQLNNVAPGDTHQVFFGSTSTTISVTCCPFGTVRSFTVIQYNRWIGGGCTPSASPSPPCNYPSDCIDSYNFPVPCLVGSPLAGTLVLLDATFGSVHDRDTVTLMEPPC